MLNAFVFAVLVILISGKDAFNAKIYSFSNNKSLFINSNTGAAYNRELGRIAGGTQATEGQFPFVVSISWQGQHICGGFIYNDGWVVTTANCVHG